MKLCLAYLLFVATCTATPEPLERSEAIPLSAVSTTSNQTGLKKVSLIEHASEEQIARFVQMRPRISFVFLAQGNLSSAVENSVTMATRAGVDSLRVADKAEPMWLCVFLGFGHSSPAYWTIAKVERRKGKVRVVYALAEPRAYATADSAPYFFWVPLGRLARGIYTLELVDEPSGETTLLRRVEIRQKTND